jgi:hypothetical protein
MNPLQVAIAAAAMVACVAFTGPSGNVVTAQYESRQQGEGAGERERSPASEREQKARERTPPPRAIVPPEGQQENPALREECSWLGQRIVSLLFRDDPTTGNDFLPFYTRFKCPEEHLNKAFACVVRSGTAENDVLADRIAQCWTDPGTDTAQQPSAVPPAIEKSPHEPGASGVQIPSVTKPAESGPK